MKHNVELLVQRAKDSESRPIPENVGSEAEGKALIQELEAHCEAKGFFEFEDIERDKNNKFCLRSRHAYRLIMGRHKVWISFRLFKTSSNRYHVDIQVQ